MQINLIVSHGRMLLNFLEETFFPPLLDRFSSFLQRVVGLVIENEIIGVKWKLYCIFASYVIKEKFSTSLAVERRF